MSAQDGREATAAAQRRAQIESWLQMGQYDRALLSAQRALAEANQRLSPDDPALASALHLVGLVYLHKGEPSTAEPLLEHALSILEQASGAPNAEHESQLCEVLNDLGELYRELGAFQRAMPLLARARTLLAERFGPEDSRLLTVLDNEGSLFQDLGDYQRAESNYQRIIEIRERTPGVDPARLNASLLNLATLYVEKGDWDHARALHEQIMERSRAAFGPEHPNYLAAIYDFAVLQAARGNYPQALELYQQVLSVAKKTVGDQHPLVARVQNALGELYDSMGDWAAAEPLLRLALESLQRSLGPDHPSVASALTNLASLLSARGDFAEAESLLTRALSIRESRLGSDHPFVANSLSALAELHAWQGHDERAVEFLSRASEVRERSTIDALASGSEAQKRSFLELSSGEEVGAVALALRTKSEPAARVALTAVLRRKCRALDVMADTLRTVRRQLDREGNSQLDELLTLRSQLAARAFAGPSPEGERVQRQQLEQLWAKEQQLESALSAKSRDYRARLRPITLDAVQAAIPEGAAVVEWTYYKPLPAASARQLAQNARVAAAILHRTGAPIWVDLGDAAAIGKLALAARQALASDAQDPRPAARALEASVFAPIRAQLGSTRSVLLAPDGVLALLPFAALIDDEQHYLIEHWEFSYLSSARDVLHFADHRAPRARPVVIGNPAFGAPPPAEPESTLLAAGHEPADSRKERVFTALPETAQEARAIFAELAPASLLLGAEATETALKAQRGPAILHIATHGFFLPSFTPAPALPGAGLNSGTAATMPFFSANASLLRSGLALAGANAAQAGREDGILSALEASALDLDGTQLVVLSACETGLGDPTLGDGVNGLRRAFVLAGSATQVMSLWNIRDDATRELMTDFYGRLRRGEPRAQALRGAQLAFLSTPKRAHPSYWAAFVLSGRADKLELMAAPASGQMPASRAGCHCSLGVEPPRTSSGPGSRAALVAGLSAALLAIVRRGRKRNAIGNGAARAVPGARGPQATVRCPPRRAYGALSLLPLLALLLALPACPPPGVTGPPIGTPGAAAKYPDGAWLSGGPTRAPATRMPKLPWPPAHWSAMEDLGEVYGRLGFQFAVVARMLKRADLQDSGVFAIEDDGFAVVTPIESITDTGEPRHDPGRFSYDEAGRILGGHFFDVLFNRKPGRYRSFTIAVTPLDLARGTKPTWNQTREHYSEGQAHLPGSIANLWAAPGTRMSVLIYEFERPAPDDEAPRFVLHSKIDARDHIAKAGLLPRNALP